MTNILKYTRLYLFLFAFTVIGFRSVASHIVGLDLKYAHVSGNTYQITLIAYGNCGSAALSTAFWSLPTATPSICIYNGATYVGDCPLTIVAPDSGIEITPVCPSELDSTQCTNTSYAIPGIKKFTYVGSYTLPAPSQYWRFLFTAYMGGTSAGRAAAITNITGAGGTLVQLVDTLNNLYSPNTNPNLTILPTPFFCENNLDNYNPGAIDPDGDSLTFQLAPAMNGTAGTGTSCAFGGACGYVAGHSATNPLGVPTTTSSMTFNSLTGQITFYPTAGYRDVVVYNVEEHRGDTLVGTSQREMTFLTLPCTNTPATAGLTGATNGTIDSGTHFHICQNTGPFTVYLNPTEPNPTNNITVTYSGIPAGATFSVTNNGTPTPHAGLSWTSNGIAAGTYTFYVTYTDNNCPLAGVQTLAYNILINPQPTDSTVVSTVACDGEALVTIYPSTGDTETIKVSSAPGDTIITKLDSGSTISYADSLGGGNYVITIKNVLGCTNSTTFNVGTVIQPTATWALIAPVTCLAKAAVSIIPGPTGAGPWVIKVSAGPGDTIQTFTGVTATFTDSLLPGSYTISVFNAQGCLATVSFTLVAPPPITPTGTFTDPTYCGATDGTIVLHELWPGTVDTIKFTYNGTVQPPQVHTVAPDSTITITGLAAGLYTAITATYGNCVSSPVGPITLTNPPFTIRALGFTNPSWCGLCDGTITIYGIHPGQTDTLNYTLGGVAQPPVVVTIPIDSQIVLTGLCAGTYSNFVVNTAGLCVSNSLGPITLAAPPFTIRAITSTNPSWCGWCDGTITLYGLHPGDVDVFTYTLNGVAQPPVTVTIPLDSEVVFSSMCAGVYANFVATKGGCVSNTVGPVTLTPPPFTVRAVTFVNPDYCGDCNGSFTLYGLHPGDVDTIYYTYNGVVQPVAVRTIGPDSTALIASLCAGTYSNIYVTKAGGCTSNTLGPIVLTVPPFLIRALSTVNPSYCGYCDGSITIYGVHPGQLDTITYDYNGVAQTPIVLVIPLDSTVVITNLCEGVYSNFIAHTGGMCTSNALGPVTLTVPPFTISYLTFTNPTKCGFCDGEIKVHGLHPGQIDTVYYQFNGVWQPGVRIIAGPDSVAVLPALCAGVYDSIVAHASGICISNYLGPVTLVAPPITASFTDSIRYGCAGDTVYLNNTSTPASDLTYRWYFGDGSEDLSTNEVHVYYTAGTYDIRLLVTNTRCWDSTNISITLDNFVKAAFTTNPDTFVCQDSLVAYFNASSGTALSYLWMFGDGSTTSMVNPTHDYVRSGQYDVALTVSNWVPCYDTARKWITVDTATQISVAVSDTAICRQSTITFTGIYAAEGNTGVSWNLGNGVTIDGVNPVSCGYDNTGTFTATVQAFYRSCPSVTSGFTVYVFPNPQVDLGADTSICPGGNGIVLTDNINNTNPLAHWLWSTGQTTPSIVVGEPGIYSLKVTIDGCTSTDSVIVKNDCYLDVPNVFTPNGDGINDFFLPRQLLSAGLTYFSMNIYNRWGQLIFTTNSLDGRGWDGDFNGVPQPEGVYIYIIEAAFKDAEHFHKQGNITLLR